MHPNSLKNLRMYPPGVSGRTGRKLPDDLLAIKSLTQLESAKLISKYARMDFETLVSLVKTKKLPVIEMAIASIFCESISKGDFMRLSFLLDRCIGKVTTIIEDDEDKEEREQLQKLSLNELLTLVKENLPDTSEAS